MTLIINEVNTAELNSLRRSVRNLEIALEHERENADILQEQRNGQILEATVYANMARSLADKLNLSRKDLLALRDEVQEICKKDLNQRGIKKFAAQPPKFSVSIK